MKFPLVSDIATTLVSYVDITSSIANALDMMLEQNHRNIIVIDSDCFRVLTVLDVLQIEKNKICLDIKLSELNLSKVPEIHKDENVLNTLEFLDNEIEYICVVNSDKTLYGLITHTDITTSIDPDTLMDNYRLLDFLK
ncbi:MAG: CBS domain-containing protein [Campylobacterota bacterium]|nr:CBS domain-containing protein [Campylobacterota bacterium]